LANREAYGITSRRQETDRRLEKLGPVWYERTLCDNCLPQSLTGPGNLVLQDTVERLFAQNLYADVDRGLFLVRGENVLLLGEIVRCPPSPGPLKIAC
jgi:transposase InsO family protein